MKQTQLGTWEPTHALGHQGPGRQLYHDDSPSIESEGHLPQCVLGHSKKPGGRKWSEIQRSLLAYFDPKNVKTEGSYIRN